MSHTTCIVFVTTFEVAAACSSSWHVLVSDVITSAKQLANSAKSDRVSCTVAIHLADTMT
jgi:hypothetical protein